MTEKEQKPMTEKESVRWRVANAHIDPDNYVFIPAKNACFMINDSLMQFVIDIPM